MFGQLIQQLADTHKERKRKDVSASHKMRESNFHERYRLAFDGQDKTTAQISGALGISHKGCNCTLRRLAQDGYVKRVGRMHRTHSFGQPAIIWRWVK